jgi:Tfp pilus assembly protein PilE
MTSLTKKIIIGVVALVLLIAIVIGIVVAAGFVSWKAAVRSGNEAAALQHLKTITAAELQYYHLHTRTFGTFDQLIKDGLLDARFSGDLPVVDGYTFSLKVTPKTASVQTWYALNADPKGTSTGKNHFYVDPTAAAIHLNADQPARASDPPVAE